MTMQEKLQVMARGSIALDIGGAAAYRRGGTRFGGQPDVPPGFVWPTFPGDRFLQGPETRPLTFLAQFDCGELARYDADHLLPRQGVLSFFYDTWSQPWGYDPRDRGCARVFWFEDPALLSPASFPPELEESCRLPMLSIGLRQEVALPGWEDFSQACPQENCDCFEEERAMLGASYRDQSSRLLGWPEVIQSSMVLQCELASQGGCLGDGWREIHPEIRRRAAAAALDRWRLLFQLDMVDDGDFSLMFGDCGRIYFYIPKEDLLARRFDAVWLVLQCY